MKLFHYLYYRSYGFYRDRLHAFDPHTYASGVPMFFQISGLFTILYALNYYKIIDLVPSNGWVLGGVGILIYSLNDRYFSGRIDGFEKIWGNEKKCKRRIKGYALLFITILVFLNIFFIANLFYKLRLIESST